MPTFDIIIPAYNAARYLQRALDSVVGQTFTDWRVLLVDDGSTDSTPEIAAQYQRQLGQKFQYARQKNTGMSAARNAAMRNVTADFIAFLDADDVWLPNRLQETYERFLQVPHAGLTHGFVARIDPEDRIVDVFDHRKPNSEGRVVSHLYMRTLDLCCPTVSVRSSCIREVGGFDETLRASEDRDLWIRVAARYDVALVPKLIAYYRMSPNSTSSDLDRMARGQLRLLEKHYGLPGCGWFARRVALHELYRQRAEQLVQRGRLAAAFRDVVTAFTFYPFKRHTVRTLLSVLLHFLRRKAHQVA